MRIVIVGPAPPLRGGIAQHTHRLKDALEQSGHLVSVISYSRLYPRWGFPGRTETEAALPVGQAVIDTLDPRTWRVARECLATLAPELVLLQWWHPVAAPALLSVIAGTAARVVAVCHNVDPHERFAGSRMLARALLRRVDHVLCHSSAVRLAVARLVPLVACDTTSMPVLIPPPRRCVRQGSAPRPAALFLGYVRPYKGVDVLLDAWMRAALPASATLTIAGESYLGAGRLERLVARYAAKGVTMLDRYLPDSEMWLQLAGAQVLVLPYRAASQSGVLPLALLAGLRAIVSDAGGLAESVAGDSRHEVVPAGDVQALARSLEKAMWAVQAATPRDALQQPTAESLFAASWRPTVEFLQRVA